MILLWRTKHGNIRAVPLKRATKRQAMKLVSLELR